jgi:hypothetical protein
MVILVFVFAYLSSYVYLSNNGKYEPIMVDLRGVERLAWAPQGFFQEGLIRGRKTIQQPKWRTSLSGAYLPLVFLDWKLWHLDIQLGDKTTYPVDEY